MTDPAFPISRALRLPRFVERRGDEALRRLLQPQGGHIVDFRAPAGEQALVGADSVSWRIFKNPVSLFVGGVAAVILQLAEPAVRTGVWEHSLFRRDPVGRLQRTGVAAMVTVYGARSRAKAMISGVVRRHEGVGGHTPAGEAYRANDVALLTWVQATAMFGFGHAYHRYVHALTPSEVDCLYGEGAHAARLYGALGAPTNDADMQALFNSMRERLEPSPIVFEFLSIMRRAPALPTPLRPLQRLLVRAAVEMTPAWVRERLGLDESFGLLPWQTAWVRRAGALSDRVMLPANPAAVLFAARAAGGRLVLAALSVPARFLNLDRSAHRWQGDLARPSNSGPKRPALLVTWG